jgi:hypothetical protein
MPYWILVCDTTKIIIPLTASTNNYLIPSNIGETKLLPQILIEGIRNVDCPNVRRTQS